MFARGEGAHVHPCVKATLTEVGCDPTVFPMSTSKSKVFSVWGEGVATSPIVRAGEPTPEAMKVAKKHGGFGEEGLIGGQWVVQVTCAESDLVAQITHDDAVKGYADIPKAKA